MKKAVIKEMSPEEFRRMQLLQLGMVSELDRVCRANHINYSIFCGTLLGAVRHKGYIPWDDDADIAMLREDYEKFKKVADQLDPNICFFQDHETEPDYRWGYGKLRRTGTTFVRAGQEHLKTRTGVFIDIFPMDDIPLSLPGQILQDFYCFCLRKILWSEVGKVSDSNAIRRGIYKLLSHIPKDFVYARTRKMEQKSRNTSPNRVRILLFPSIGKLYTKNSLRTLFGMEKNWFTNLTDYEFEGQTFRGTKDYDRILKYTYGNYMELPPEEEREPHAPVSYYEF